MASVIVSNVTPAVVSIMTCDAKSNVDITLLSSVFDTGIVASAATALTAPPPIACF